MELSQRQERVLACVVAAYSQTGEPVGSKAVAEQLGVSSATVRNEMAGLISLGLLEQPHTSAGRIPSQRGYREYVDRLMPPAHLDEGEMRALSSRLSHRAYDPEGVLRQAARLLAEATRCAGLATTPGGAQARVKAVQFVQTGRRTAMLILLSSAGTMQTRVFRCDFDMTPELTRLFFRVCNERLAGKAVADITPAFAQTMAASLGELYVLLGPPLQALLEAARDTMETKALLSGQMNLLLYPELEQQAVRRVLAFLERREGLAFQPGRKPGRAQVIIGQESGRPELEGMSLVAARYRVEGQDAGTLSVVGPVRMDYPRHTALVEYLAGQTGQVLTGLAQDS